MMVLEDDLTILRKNLPDWATKNILDRLGWRLREAERYIGELEAERDELREALLNLAKEYRGTE